VKGFRRLAGITLAASIALVAVGGLVRASGSGEGCGPGKGDTWPLCVGGVLPPLEYHALIEFSHRLLAAILVGLTGALVVWAYRRLRDRRDLVRGSVAAAAIVVAQAALGAIVVEEDTEKYLVAVHFAAAMVLVGALTWLFVRSFDLSREGDDSGKASRLAMLTRALAAGAFALLVVGAYARGSNASLVFLDWPLMQHSLIPPLGGPATTMFLHRLLALGTGILTACVLMQARKQWCPPIIRKIAWLAVGMLALQILAGAANVLTRLTPWAMVLHVTTSALVWTSVVALATVAGTVARQATTAAVQEALPTSARGQIAAYFQLMKPRIIVLLLITTVPAMVLAAGRVPSVFLMAATLLGGTLAAGSANAINCYIDRDIDMLMRRTRRRPVPAHRVTPDHALEFGFALGAVAFFFMAIVVNLLAAFLAVSAIFFYVFVYTMWLKRRTDQNIVIGGAAGAVPALVGWAAVTGHVGIPAVMLFAIIFVWTPPHFWALAMKYEKDYAAAGIPMMPVVRGREDTVTQILIYSLALVLVTLAMYPLAHMGQIYLASATTLGGIFVFKALKLKRSQDQADAWKLFKYSILYLALLFAAVAVDRLAG
jgi:protoheme IX farnesyltransferase